MKFYVAAETDQGITKAQNQDSLMVRQMVIDRHQVVFGAVCDGMGGGQLGEVASASVLNALNTWCLNSLPEMIRARASKDMLKESWVSLLSGINEKLFAFARSSNMTIGTTCAVLLIIDEQYFIMNVGDSRVYEIKADGIRLLTEDQSVVAREVRLGILTEEQARMDPRRSILLQSIGAMARISPDLYAGRVTRNSLFLICSDGFRHEVTEREMELRLQPGTIVDKADLSRRAVELIQLNMARHETDNISAVLVKAY